MINMPPPKDPIKREEYLKRQSESRKGCIPWNKGKKGLQIAWNKGIPRTEEEKKNISKGTILKTPRGKDHPNYGKPGLRGKDSPRFGAIDPKGKDHHLWKGGRKLNIFRRNTKRRELGNNFLNNPFPNSHGHHINLNDVIYVPKEYNKISHDVRTGRNMEVVNSYAYFFLMMQNIKEFRSA